MSHPWTPDPIRDDRGGDPSQILRAMARLLVPVALETVDLAHAHGRVLATPLLADRDSPAINVSAMDGYAIRLADARPGPLNIRGEALIGKPPMTQPDAAVVKIGTGAPLPIGADAVVRREAVRELDQAIIIDPGEPIRPGQDIRRRGENTASGSIVLDSGVALSPTAIGACATFGLAKVPVYRRIRVGLIITGDELLTASDAPQPWQLRDSNGPALTAMLDALPWIEPSRVRHVRDDLRATVETLKAVLRESDAVIMTGGVSMGNRDFAQIAACQVDARTIFHGLPIRPGKPMLGAITADNKPILGLPGNPVSMIITARRFALILLRHLAGFGQSDPSPGCVAIDQPDHTHANAWLYRPVRLLASGNAQLLSFPGTGDIVVAGRSDGFVEIAPNTSELLHRPFYAWRP